MDAPPGANKSTQEKKLHGNYKRMLRAVLNKFWKQCLSRQQLYSHLPGILKTMPVRRTSHAGRNKDELISNILLRTPAHGRASVGRPAENFIHQLRIDPICCLKDML